MGAIKLLPLVVLTCGVLSDGWAEQGTPLDASIVVEAGQVLGPVNRQILGQNLEAGDVHGIFSDRPGKSNDGQGFWDPEKRAFVPEFLEKARQLSIGSLRYPGGCLAHGFDWKKTIGPLADRPNFQFGLDEFMALCRELKSEPVMIVSDYTGTAQDAADLVEYLNAPATDAHPWAQKRAANGHPEPYGVKWFELGNESYHGNHQIKPFRVFSPSEYAAYARTYAAKMKAVDPGVRVGLNAVPGNTTNIDTEWNRIVFQEAAEIADFVAVHFYTPSVQDKLPEGPEGQRIVQEACMAIGGQLPERLSQYREYIRKHGGRDLPLAITEYNVGAATQQKPYPYRFTFVGALFAADVVRVGLRPENGVLFANYWQLANGYWSMINTYPGRVAERPAYPLYRLWGQALGRDIVKTVTQSPSASFAGYPGVSLAMSGGEVAPAVESDLPMPLLRAPAATQDLAIARSEDGGVAFQFTNYSGEHYPQIFEVAKPASIAAPVDYGLSFEARVVAADGSAVKDLGTIGLGLVDARGWEATGSATALSGVENASEWMPFQGRLNALTDAPGVHVVGRLNIKKPFSGRLEVRNIKLRVLPKEIFPEYPLLADLAMMGADGRLRLVVFNKSLDRPIRTRIELRDYAAKSVSYSEVRDTPIATTATDTHGGSLSTSESGAVEHTFPPLSMSVLTFDR